MLLALLLWCTRWSGPAAAAVPELDPSWQQALGQALVQRLDFGTELVFTYGPLGWFTHGAWQPELWGWKFWFFEGLVKLALCAVLARAWLRLDSWLERLLLAALLLIPDPGVEAFYFVCLTALARWLLDLQAAPAMRSLPAWLLWALIAWIKFSYFLLAGALGAVLLGVLLVRRRARAAAVQAGLALAALVLVWSATGQPLSALVPCIVHGLELARGYPEALSGPSLALHAWLALGAGVAVLVSLCLAERRWILLALFVPGAVLAQRAGFTTGGSAVLSCLGFLLLAPFLLTELPRVPGARRNWSRATLWLAAGLALAGYQHVLAGAIDEADRPLTLWARRVASNAERMLTPGAERAAFEAQREQLASEHALPRIRAAVGAERVDLFCAEQGALFLNDLVWAPRPVFQSYAAYTPRLLELNAAYYRGERAPRFVILRFTTIDNRLPGMEDVPALSEVLARYHPVLSEREYLLFERDSEPRAVAGERTLLFERRVRFGEQVDLAAYDRPGTLLQLAIEPTLAGRAQLLCVTPPRIEADVVLALDGGPHRCRVVPGCSAGGVFAVPFLNSQERWQAWASGVALERLIGFTLVDDARVRAIYGDEYTLRLIHDPRSVPPQAPAEPPSADAELLALFAPPPARFEGPHPLTWGRLAGRAACVQHAPSTLEFTPGAGRWHLAARYGLPEAAWERGCSDGAAFVVLVRDAAGAAQPLWRRLLLPAQEAADRGEQVLELDFELAEGEVLLVETRVGPERHAACDWTAWTAFTLTALP